MIKFGFQGAFGNQCRGGHMFAPLKVWRRWHRRVNLAQVRNNSNSESTRKSYSKKSQEFENFEKKNLILNQIKEMKFWIILKFNFSFQKRYAVCSAIAASGMPALLQARGHVIDKVRKIIKFDFFAERPRMFSTKNGIFYNSSILDGRDPVRGVGQGRVVPQDQRGRPVPPPFARLGRHRARLQFQENQVRLKKDKFTLDLKI